MTINLPTMNKAYLSHITVANIYEFYPQDGTENQSAQIRNEITSITSLSPYVAYTNLFIIIIIIKSEATNSWP